MAPASSNQSAAESGVGGEQVGQEGRQEDDGTRGVRCVRCGVRKIARRSHTTCVVKREQRREMRKKWPKPSPSQVLHLAADRIIHDAEDWLLADGKANRDRNLERPVHKICRAVNRIHDPCGGVGQGISAGRRGCLGWLGCWIAEARRAAARAEGEEEVRGGGGWGGPGLNRICQISGNCAVV